MSDKALFPARYDAMCRAIDAAYEVDEVKEIRDQARAFEVYAQQAQNREAELRACEIRLRAERKAGLLLRAMDRATAEQGRPPKASSATTLSSLGLSRDQSAKWQRLANVPDDQFEAALRDPTIKPSTTGIIDSVAPKPKVTPVSENALWLWGRLREFERDGLLARDPADTLHTLTPRMLDEVHRLAPQVAAWLNRIGESS